MTGKEKCAILKQIRRDIAEKNDIAVTIADCKHKGDCKGTCPKCEAEVRELEKALEKRKKAGLKATVAGISAGLLAALQLTSCDPLSGTDGGAIELEGDVPMQVSETDEAALKGKMPAQDTETLSVTMGELVPEVEEGEIPVPETEEAQAEELPQ